MVWNGDTFKFSWSDIYTYIPWMLRYPRLPRFCRVGRVGWTQTCQAERYSRQNLILKLGQKNANLPGKTRQAKEPSTIILGHWKFQFIKYCSLSMLFPIACSSPQLLAYHVSQLTNSVAKHLWAVSLCSNYCFGDMFLLIIFHHWSLDISWLDMAVDRVPRCPSRQALKCPSPRPKGRCLKKRKIIKN